jgi:3' terminal RNA ribose 2'-O-methyltransferase Hen1
MLLELTTTHTPATDLGYLLHKHPARVHRRDLSFGTATVFFSEARAERCTAVLAVEVDPVGLVRREDGRGLEQYVNDRPYALSSFMCVALAEMFGSALGGRARDKPELAERALPFEIRLTALPLRGGERTLRALFEPLGYTVTVELHPLDPDGAWGPSRYADVTLDITARLAAVLEHLYVLIPVLDDDKHYWVGDDEVDKLKRRGADWLPEHPARELILQRYLKRQRRLVELAEEALEIETAVDANSDSGEREAQLEAPNHLNAQRLERIALEVQQCGARSVIDLGCGEGRLLKVLAANHALERITGLDVSVRALEHASARLKLERLNERDRARFLLLHGSLGYFDERTSGYDIATVIEVIEHLEPHRLQAFERVLFDGCRASRILLTTPNREYNVRYQNLPAGEFRHLDHRFEWTRAEFQAWASAAADAHGYTVRFDGIGEVDAELGAPTQLACFERSGG